MQYITLSKTGAFDAEDVTHIDGEVNPVRDILTIMDELRLKVIRSNFRIHLLKLASQFPRLNMPG